MSKKLTYDAIVVGGGPAGIAAAITMVKGGLKVIVIERGRFAGAKNFFGGVMYTHAFRDVLPDFWDRKPPFERPVTEQGYWMMSPDSVVRIMHKSQKYQKQPADSYVALRAKVDPWFAQQAVDIGVSLITKTVVNGFIKDEKGRVIGVTTDRPEGDIYAPVVIIAEGVNNLLTQKLGLIQHDLHPHYVALSVKEHISLPTKELEGRFNISGSNEGVAIDIFGDATVGLPGLAYLYTDKGGVSIGVGLLLSEFANHNIKPYEVLARFKEHPVIKPLLLGGESLEYGAHLIPESGYDHMPALYTDGVMIAGDAAGMVDALHREGTNLAMTAGKFAGETAIEATNKQDFSAAFLKAYRKKLEDTFVLKDLKQYRYMTDFLDTTPQLMDTYMNLLNDAALRYFTAHGMPKRDMENEIFGMVRQRRSLIGVAQDMMKLLRGMRG